MGVAVGDVGGHGIAAVATMAQLRNALRAYAFEGARPAEVLARLDDYVVKSGVADLATVLYGTFDLRSHELCWSHAGHPPPLLVPRAGPVEVLSVPGQRPVGFFDRVVPGIEHTVLVPDGALLVLYTDGLIERRGESLDDGIARLGQAAVTLAGRTVGTCRRLRDRCVPDDHEDDVCILTFAAATR